MSLGATYQLEEICRQGTHQFKGTTDVVGTTLGTFVANWGLDTDADSAFEYAAGVYIDATGVWLGTTTNHALQVYTNNGAVQAAFETDKTLRMVGAIHWGSPAGITVNQVPSPNEAAMDLSISNIQQLNMGLADDAVDLTIDVKTGTGMTFGTMVIQQNGSVAYDLSFVAGSGITTEGGNIYWVTAEPTWTGMGLGAVRFIEWKFLGIDLYLRDMGEYPYAAGPGDFTTLATSGLATFGAGLTFTGAQTIQTSTGQLDVKTAAGNGDIVLTPHGTGVVAVTGTESDVLAVGANGATNPVLQVDANTASVATGVKVTGAAAASGVSFSAISSGTNEDLAIDAKGSGTITLAGTSTGDVFVGGSSDLVFPNSQGVYIKDTGGTATQTVLMDSANNLNFRNNATSGSVYLGTNWANTTGVVYIQTKGSNRAVITANGDLGLGASSGPSANGGKVIFFGDNTADPTMAINTCGVYGKDVAGTVETFAVDEAGNATQLTPHAKDGPAAIYSFSPGVEAVLATSNSYLGKVRWVNLEDSTKTVIVEDFTEYNARRGLSAGDAGFKELADWETNQDLQEQQIQTLQADWDTRNQNRLTRFRNEAAQFKSMPMFLRKVVPALEEIEERPKDYVRKPNPFRG